MNLRRTAARAVAVSAVTACLGLAAPAAQANEMTIGDGGPCDFSATVWWNVPPPPGQRPAGATVSWGCLQSNIDLTEYLPSTQPLPFTIDSPLEP